MKRFFKYILIAFSGTFFGLCAFALILVGIVAGIVEMSNDNSVSVAPKSVLLIRLHEPIAEVSSFDILADVSPFSSSRATLGIRNIVQAINHAADNPNICAIALYTDIIPAGYATVSEIQQALLNFKKSGKAIVSYSDVLTQKSYALAATANSVYINPEASVESNGMFSQFISYKNLLAKIGLRPIVHRAGKYKSFTESLTQEKMSDENRQQVQQYVSETWNNYTRSVETLRPLRQPLALIADSMLVWNAQSAKQYGMVDSLCYYNDFLNTLAHISGNDAQNIPFISLANYIQYSTADTEQLPNKLCVISAEGDITLGKGTRSEIGSETLAKRIRTARNNSNVKAIVLRINSGGGAALAAEAVWHEMNMTRGVKPLIVSMGDVAASGAYYIAAPADVIVANPSTLTGSIGVFGVSLNSEELLQKIGISVDSVKSSNFADFGTPTREPFSHETFIMEQGIDQTYNAFKKRVAQGRNMSEEQVEAIAQGKVWTGVAAQKISLVDTLGGLQLAIQIAAQHAGIENNYSLQLIPRQQNTIEQLMETINENASMSNEIKALLGTQGETVTQLLQQIPREKGLYMKLPYIIQN